MKRLLTENLSWKIISVILAFLLWVAVAREPELATSIAVPILFRNVPGGADLGSDIPDRVHLEIRGPASRLTAPNLAQVAVVLNLADLEPGERTFNIRDSNVHGLPIGVSFDRAVPSQVSLRFEHLLAKSVPIEPTYLSDPPEGFSVAEYHFSPARVVIKGPDDHVRNIDHVTTDPIDLNEMIGGAEKRAHVRLPDPQVRMESRTPVIFTVRLQKISGKEHR